MDNADSTDPETTCTTNEGGNPDYMDLKTGLFYDLKTWPSIDVEEKTSGFTIEFSFYWRDWKIALRNIEKYDEYRFGPFGFSCHLLTKFIIDGEAVGD